MADVAFKNVFCSGHIHISEDLSDMVVQGQMNEAVQDNQIAYVAAAPPDYRATFTGSGLPFANQTMAFESTPNRGTAPVHMGRFEFRLMYPNSYYVGLGSVIVPPTVYIEYVTLNGEKRNVSIKLSDGVPFRLLTYPSQFTRPRQDAMFYADAWSLPVRTQEQILRDAAYPGTNKMPSNFWGLKPPV